MACEARRRRLSLLLLHTNFTGVCRARTHVAVSHRSLASTTIQVMVRDYQGPDYHLRPLSSRILPSTDHCALLTSPYIFSLVLGVCSLSGMLSQAYIDESQTQLTPNAGFHAVRTGLDELILESSLRRLDSFSTAGLSSS